MTLLWYKDLESINIKTVRVLDLLKDGDNEWMHLCGTCFVRGEKKMQQCF